MISALAQADTSNQINQVQEVYLDYLAVNPRLFHLEIESSVGLSKRQRRDYTFTQEKTMTRMVEGIQAALLSLRVHDPVIRYDEGS